MCYMLLCYMLYVLLLLSCATTSISHDLISQEPILLFNLYAAIILE